MSDNLGTPLMRYENADATSYGILPCGDVIETSNSSVFVCPLHGTFTSWVSYESKAS